VKPNSSPGANATRLASSPGADATGLASPTLAACLTPPGRSAIATLGIRGPRAWEIVRELFRTSAASPQELPAIPDLSRIWLGRIGEKDSANVADQVVVTVQQTTPIPCVEIHSHGGTETVRWLLEILEKQGCRVCAWPELEQATTTDPWKTAASLELVKASTVRTAAILLDQYHGAFARALIDIQTALTNQDLPETTRLLESLARYAHIGRHLTVPWKVAVVGPPNVGKSSLVNALAGFQRSLVTPTPGTTRDLVTTLIAVDGWPVELIDTAGLREESGSVEGQGIELARNAAASADLCLWLLDASAPPIWPEPNLRDDSKFKLVVNKIDRPPAWEIKQSDVLQVSALTGAGLAELVETIARWLVPNPPPPGAAVPFTPSLASQVEEALNHARAGRMNQLSQSLMAISP
jgi:tRNA modification GTPase